MTAPAPLVSRLRGTRARRRNERSVKAVLMFAAVLTVAISIGIVASLIFEAFEFLRSVDLGRLFSAGWFPRRDLFDLPTVLPGTLIVTAGSLSRRTISNGSAIAPRTSRRTSSIS